jgi:Mg-chelatase subunit ChlD
MVPTEIDIVIMIDGSGSMNGAPLNAALQASAIMFEAASGKDMKMNVYVGMWGDSNPPMLIYPGADRIEIGKQMERAHKGLNCGTDLAPAIKKVAQTIGEQRGRSGTLSGFTHVLILSDGDIFDADKAKERIMTMFDYSDKVTVDTAVINGQKGSSMERMAKGIKGHKHFQDVGVTIGSNPNETPMEIVGLLLEKVRKCGSFVAVPNSQKRRAMQKAHNKMDRKP